MVNPTLCPLLGSIPSTLTTKNLVAFLQLLDRLNVCVGQPDSRFVTMVQQKNDTTMSAAGNKTAYIDSFAPVYWNERSYTVTVRTVQGKFLTTENKCKVCKLYRDTLRTLSNRLAKSATIASDNHTNERYAGISIFHCCMHNAYGL